MHCKRGKRGLTLIVSRTDQHKEIVNITWHWSWLISENSKVPWRANIFCFYMLIFIDTHRQTSSVNAQQDKKHFLNTKKQVSCASKKKFLMEFNSFYFRRHFPRSFVEILSLSLMITNKTKPGFFSGFLSSCPLHDFEINGLNDDHFVQWIEITSLFNQLELKCELKLSCNCTMFIQLLALATIISLHTLIDDVWSCDLSLSS